MVLVDPRTTDKAAMTGAKPTGMGIRDGSLVAASRSKSLPAYTRYPRISRRDIRTFDLVQANSMLSSQKFQQVVAAWKLVLVDHRTTDKADMIGAKRAGTGLRDGSRAVVSPRIARRPRHRDPLRAHPLPNDPGWATEGADADHSRRPPLAGRHRCPAGGPGSRRAQADSAALPGRDRARAAAVA